MWLQPRLAERGLEASEPIQEDWGWVILVTLAGCKFTISVGVMDDSIGQIPANWRVGVAYEKPLNRVRNLIQTAPDESLVELFRDVQSVLVSEPRFKVSEEVR